MKVSVIVLTKESASVLGDCLESAKWADETVVVDSGSRDATKEIAQKYNARFFNFEKGFSQKRNFGAQKARGEWLLYLDSDERITPLLREEIKKETKTTKDTGTSAYAIARRNILLGREMKYGGWWPDYVVRLIKKTRLKGWKGEVHEQPQVSGRTSKLKNPMTHISHRNIGEMVEKTNQWSEIEAKLLFDSNHPKMTWWRFFSVAFREFWFRGVRKLGFLDGVEGVIEIVYQMFSRMVTYAKLWEMQEGRKK